MILAKLVKNLKRTFVKQMPSSEQDLKFFDILLAFGGKLSDSFYADNVKILNHVTLEIYVRNMNYIYCTSIFHTNNIIFLIENVVVSLLIFLNVSYIL